MRLTVPAQSVQEGAFVVVESGEWLFYGLVTDLQLGATDPRFADEQSEERLPANLAALLHGQTLYTNLEVLPALMVEQPPDPATRTIPAGGPSIEKNPARPIPIKTVPPHHAPVRLASAGDMAEIFGDPAKKGNFVIGYTREQGHPVCIDLDKFVQRSSGIFGATGTGKSFLTRIILAGLIHSNVAGALIFDMHNEYGSDDTASDTNQRIPGLKGKFPTKVRLVGLGRGSDFRGVQPDFNLEIAERDIETGDIEMLTRELNLKETTPTTLDALEREFGQNWFQEFKQLKYGAKIETEDGKSVDAPDSVAAWAHARGGQPGAAEGLHSKLRRVFNLPYIVERPAADTVSEIIKALEARPARGALLRRPRQRPGLPAGDQPAHPPHPRRLGTQDQRIPRRKSQEPRPLVIVVEEAHKLLNREMAAQTTFSTIAREMRKYYVTLLIIDQRPSQIYDEVMSQLGTRVSGWLGDEDDIQAVLSGLAGRDALRGMLARLQPKEEVLLLGWGVPMPIPVRSRRYDDDFWKDLLGSKAPGKRDESDIMKALGY